MASAERRKVASVFLPPYSFSFVYATLGFCWGESCKYQLGAGRFICVACPRRNMRLQLWRHLNLHHICRFANLQPLEAHTQTNDDKLGFTWKGGNTIKSVYWKQTHLQSKPAWHLNQQECNHAIIKPCPEEVQRQLQVVYYYTTMPNLQAKWYLHQRQKFLGVNTA